MKLNLTWKRQTGLYQQGGDLYINKIHIGSYRWNSLMSREETTEYKKAHQYIGNCLLPGFINNSKYEATPNAIKCRIERMVTIWFTEALK